MSDAGNIQAGDVINPPKGPFWNRRDRVKISQIATAVANAQIRRGKKDAVHISGRNLVFELKDAPAADTTPTPAAGSGKLYRALILEVLDEYLSCTALSPGMQNNVSANLARTLVSKPWWFRPSVYQKWSGSNPRLTYDGYHTYLKTGVQSRSNTVWSPSQSAPTKVTFNEVIWPDYQPGDEILCAEVSGGSGVIVPYVTSGGAQETDPVIYIDVTTREWITQFNDCNDTTAATRYLGGTIPVSVLQGVPQQ